MGTVFLHTLSIVAVVSLLAITVPTTVTLAQPTPPNEETASPKTTHFSIAEALMPLSPEVEGILLNVFSGSLENNELTLYIGFRNQGTSVRKSFGILTRTDCSLYQGDRLTPQYANQLSANLSLMMPEAGILPGLTNSGMIRFSLQNSQGPFRLRIAGFEPVTFDPANAKRLNPATASPQTIPNHQNLILTNAQQSLAVIRLHVDNVAVSSNGEVRADVAFENSSHRDLTFSTELSGKQLYLLDSHQTLHVPVEVSESLSESIGPSNGIWSASRMTEGWVRYKIENPHALNSFALSFPEYNSLVATFNEESKSYDLRIESRPGHGSGAAASPLVAASEMYRELIIFFNALNTRLNDRQYEAFLSPFSATTGARQSMSDFLVLLGKVPVHSARFFVPNEQDINPDARGHLKEIVVYLQYQIADIARPIIAKFRCNLVLDQETNAWSITRFLPERLLPFWILGYNGVKNTDHFLLFYRPDSASDDKIGKAARQVEKAYQTLSKIKSLSLEQRYPAFFIDRQDDFANITGRNPSRVTGAVAAVTEIRDDRFVVTSGGLYINDFSFLSPSNTWGTSEREDTITHELVHLALSDFTRPFMPLWIVEGTAVHFAKQNDSFTRQALKDSGTLDTLNLSQLCRAVSTNPEVIKTLGGERIYYQFSGETVSYLIRTYGEERFLNFYRAFADYTPSQLRKISHKQLMQEEHAPLKFPLLGHHITQHLVRIHFGLELETIDREVKAHLYRKTL
ncbi:MAG: hypothetical protein AAGD22_04880 [Verrucomicrobiota bacterium]